MTDDTTFEEECRRADERARAKRRDLYDVLGVSRDATPEQLKKAFINSSSDGTPTAILKTKRNARGGSERSLRHIRF